MWGSAQSNGLKFPPNGRSVVLGCFVNSSQQDRISLLQ
jgi:hypothetical protein